MKKTRDEVPSRICGNKHWDIVSRQTITQKLKVSRIQPMSTTLGDIP